MLDRAQAVSADFGNENTWSGPNNTWPTGTNFQGSSIASFAKWSRGISNASDRVEPDSHNLLLESNWLSQR